MKHITAVRTVTIPVTDQDRALEFYRRELGFETLMDAPLPQLGGRWLVVGIPGTSTSIALLAATETGVDTGIRLATADAAQAHTALNEQGVATSELIAWPGVPPMFTFTDCDGNRLYLVQE
ncbi:VOC family protein [Kribbella sp. CA-293567]|uniref:VOC family protein n=1 Tax=Kribbella sp. CA-293567 TaxID=3002436 RepID=UPI0022DE4528|nr:VOC family protein [Kribbella sp. CA-293567]WBQ02572.1 VOC family protein [Kribbella sp. CA-293567]